MDQVLFHYGISDFLRDSIYKKDTLIIGSTNNKNYLSKNYFNIKLITLIQN